jgi:hypothetical protein
MRAPDAITRAGKIDFLCTDNVKIVSVHQTTKGCFPDTTLSCNVEMCVKKPFFSKQQQKRVAKADKNRYSK